MEKSDFIHRIYCLCSLWFGFEDSGDSYKEVVKEIPRECVDIDTSDEILSVARTCFYVKPCHKNQTVILKKSVYSHNYHQNSYNLMKSKEVDLQTLVDTHPQAVSKLYHIFRSKVEWTFQREKRIEQEKAEHARLSSKYGGSGGSEDPKKLDELDYLGFSLDK